MIQLNETESARPEEETLSLFIAASFWWGVPPFIGRYGGPQYNGQKLTLLGNICANNTAAQDKCMVENVRAADHVALATAALGDLAQLAALDLNLNYLPLHQY